MRRSRYASAPRTSSLSWRVQTPMMAMMMARQWPPRRCETRRSFCHFRLTTITLPRQARDRHRENSKKGLEKLLSIAVLSVSG